MVSAGNERNLNEIIKIDEVQVENHLGEMVRGTVQETLNARPDAEAKKFVPGEALRADGGPDRHPGGSLYPQAAYPGR